MLRCGEKIRVSVGLANECVIPSGILRGEVIVVVSPDCPDGIRYKRIRLELRGVEHNGVRDDQGEFDELLEGYTADRTYLDRHVTLSGKKKASEDLETALQRKQEVMFRNHHTAPYSRVIPVKNKKPKQPKKKKKANKGHGAAASPSEGQGRSMSDGAATGGPSSQPDHSASSSAPHQQQQQGGSAHLVGSESQRRQQPREGRAERSVSSSPTHSSSSSSDGGDSEMEERERGSGTGDIGLQDISVQLAGKDNSNANSPSPATASASGTAAAPFMNDVTAPNCHVEAPTLANIARLSAAQDAANAQKAAAIEKQVREEQHSNKKADKHQNDHHTKKQKNKGRDVAILPSAAAATPEVEAERLRVLALEPRLMPGRYTFPFSFRVPPWLPPSLYYSIDDASGSIAYSARATVEFGPGKHDLASHKRFYVLSAISRRQLIACHEEAITAATTTQLPPLSALFQVFACDCMGNLCCLASHSAVEVEVALQCSRALVLSDANATYRVFRDYQTTRDEIEDAKMSGGGGCGDGDSPPRVATVGEIASGQPQQQQQAFSGYDAFMERKFQAAEDDEYNDPAAFVDMFLNVNGAKEADEDNTGIHKSGVAGGASGGATTSDGSAPSMQRPTPGTGGGGMGAGQKGSSQSQPSTRAAKFEAIKKAKQDALRQRRRDVEKALPLPIGVLPLVIRVHNGCMKREIPRVRVELRQTVQVMKSLEMPRVFEHPLARYDYTVSIPPGDEVTFAAPLQLPKQFRRCKQDDPKLVPPPGVKTANLCTSTVISVTFPGLTTYVEEEDWVNSVVQLAEAVDMNDEVLDLPTRYS